jgi:hypothetical protein
VCIALSYQYKVAQYMPIHSYGYSGYRLVRYLLTHMSYVRVLIYTCTVMLVLGSYLPKLWPVSTSLYPLCLSSSFLISSPTSSQMLDAHLSVIINQKQHQIAQLMLQPLYACYSALSVQNRTYLLLNPIQLSVYAVQCRDQYTI